VIVQFYLRTIQRAWWLIIMTTLLGLTISLGISYATTPLYRASASLIVYPNANLTSSRDMVTSLDTLDKRSITSTYEDILNSKRVFDEAAKGLQFDPKELTGYTHWTAVQPESNTIELLVEGPNPQIVTQLANDIAKNGINYIKGIYQVFDITFLDTAVMSWIRVKPQALRDGAIALGIGFLAGILLAVLSEQIRAPLEILRRRAISDRFSSAYTTRHFKRLLEQEIVRRPLEPLSLALLDLEGLHELVEALPEPVLTSLLHTVTTILRNQLRGNDVVGRWHQTAFALMLPSTPGSAATRTMERIRQALSEPITLEATAETVSLIPSVGLTERLQEDEPSSLMIQHAETALEKARQSDKKTVLYAQSQ